MGLTQDLEELIENNDADGLEAKFTKQGRPRKGTRAITSKDKDHCLDVAMPHANFDVLEVLFRHEANLTRRSFDAALERGNEEMSLLDLMLKWGWKVGGKGLWYGESVAGAAIHHENTLRWVLEYGAELNVVSNPRLVGSCADLATPLQKAASRGLVKAMYILLEFGARPDASAIFFAIRSQATESLRFLLAKGVDANIVSWKWGTPLKYAVRWHNSEAVEVLLDCGADPEVVRSGSTAADDARERGYVELAEMLEARMKRKSRRIRGLRPA
ncbi:ankyrin repeat-containing domain protein [Alternaria rosae]|uniref:ankyrin repeat-containing domain protein n=1 Tax=Alternaria rosae TaxID=1187941 RepID=UPI001E8D5ADE|nr:ankyrin repeat-containing domain protein [Alternaria rosae]KAH6865942.1 ankyrin repeat-containing domain protein [Alternaria rosae]